MTDVTNKVDEVMDKAEDIVEEVTEEVTEEAVDMAKDVKKVVVKEEPKFRIFSLGALKYIGAGILGAGVGVWGKTVYDDRKVKRANATATPFVEVAPTNTTSDEEFDYSVEF